MPQWTPPASDRVKPKGWQPPASDRIQEQSKQADANGWRQTQYGFKVRPATNPETGQPTLQREDGALWFDKDPNPRFGSILGNLGMGPGAGGWLKPFDNGRIKGFAPAGSVPGESNNNHGLGIVGNAMRPLERAAEGGLQLMDRAISPLAPTPPSQLGLSDLVRGSQPTQPGMTPDQLAASNERAYQANKYTGRGGSTAEFLGNFAVPVPGVGAGGGMLARYVARPALQGMMGAALQPVQTTPDENGGDNFWSQKLLQTGFGAGSGIVANAAMQPVTKLVNKVSNAFTGKTPDVNNIREDLLSRVKGEPADVIQADLQSQQAAAAKKAADAYGKVWELSGDKPLDYSGYKKTVQDSLAQLESSSVPNQAAIQKAKGILAQLESGKVNQTFQGAHFDRSELGNMANAAYEAGDKSTGRIFKSWQQALNQDMDKNAAELAQTHPGIKEAYENAKNIYKSEVVPWSDPKQGGSLLKRFMDTPTPDQALNGLVKAGPDKAQIFVKQLSPEGRSALQAGLVDTAFKEADDGAGNFVASKFVKAMKDRQEAYKLTFTGEDKFRMDGLQKIMKDSAFIGKVVPTGKLSAIADTSVLAQQLFSTKAGRSFLLAASTLEPNSSRMAQLVDAFAKKSPQIAGIQAGQATAGQSQEQP